MQIRTKTNNGNFEIVAGPSGHNIFKGSVEISVKCRTVEIIFFHTVDEAMQHTAAIMADEVEYPGTGIDYDHLGRAEAAHAASQFHQ